MQLNLSIAKVATAILIASVSALMTVLGVAEPIKKSSKRPDGSSIHWSIEHPESGKKRGLLLIAQGSGCLPAIRNPSVAQAKSIAPEFSVLLVEKYGVGHGDKPDNPIDDCSKGYFAHHTVSQRAEDVEQVIDDLKDSDGWNGKLVLFGGSEGGALVARLTPRLEPDATVVFSTGLGEPLVDSLARVIPPPALAEAKQKLAEARANPDSIQVWGGNSYRWWADVMDDVLVNELLKTRVPVLLVQGERDQSAPVQSGRAARDAYAAAGRCELTYWEMPGYDHFMTDGDGENHRQEVFTKISTWIGSALGGDTPGCSNQN